MLNYRLGLDMGTNSLGWCAVHIRKDGSPVEMLDWGVRIFDDGREPAKKEVPGESSAVQRRTARGMRRRYDRKLMRKKATMRALVACGLMPEDATERKKLEALEPLKLRNEALSHKLDNPYEIGRALFHLQQRRGFKSNRKELQVEGDNKIDGMKLGMRNLETMLEVQNLTIGQFLYETYQKDGKRQSTRFQPRMEEAKAKYEYYPTRALVEQEFNAIWDAQAKHYPARMTEEARKAVHKAIFYQRKLKSQPKGHCSILLSEARMAWAMPTAQHFRIAKEIANLRIIRVDDWKYKSKELSDRQRLSPEQRKKLYEALCKPTKNKFGSITFGQIRTLIGLTSGDKFNLESEARKGLDGDKTAVVMRRQDYFGSAWDTFSLDKKSTIIEQLLDDRLENEDVEQWLIEHCSLPMEQARRIVEAPLPPGYAKFGKTVITKILPRMRDKGMLEHEAIEDAGFGSHRQSFTGEVFDALPYYGELLKEHVVINEALKEKVKKHGLKNIDPNVLEHGRISNPTVHIALNQLRRLMNQLKKRYGCWPQEIVVEMARELKKGRSEIAEIMGEITKNTNKRKKWKENIEKYKAEATADDYLKMKLWEELAKDPTHRKCIYTGDTIGIEMLFNGKTQIDHILPNSLTLDNASANLLLVTQVGNQIKRNQTPYKAFCHQSGDYSYEAVCERAQILPKSKQWRFRQDAMEVFESKAKTIMMKSSLDGGEEILETGLEPFAARQLIDTSYIAKIGKKYLAYACASGERGVQATPGTLTGLLRKAWKLNTLLHPDETDKKLREEKNRNDHRHHALDALIVAMTTRSMVKSVADAAKQEEQTGISLVKHIPKPFEWSDLKARLDAIVVSHKPDHGSPAQAGGGTSGRLHEDTYYGYVGEGKKKGTLELVVRVPLLSLKNSGELDAIRDKELREAVQQFVYEHDGTFEESLRSFAESDAHQWRGIRNVRVLVEKSRDSMIPVKKYADGNPWKMAVGGDNQRADIFRELSGKKAGKWQLEPVSTYNANQFDFIPKWRSFPDTEFIMALHKNDTVAYEDNGVTYKCRVKEIWSNGQVVLTHHYSGGKSKKKSEESSKVEWSLMASSMQKKQLRHLSVEIDGSIYDPLGILTTPKFQPPKEAA